MSEKINEIDTDQERDVEIVKESFKNWWKVLIILTPILATIIFIVAMAMSDKGVDLLKSIFGKQPTIIQNNIPEVKK